jgi:hypothetical protein
MKVERENTEVIFPPTWCSPICKNSMNDVCIEDCALERKAAWFDMKPGLTLEDLPRFPLNDVDEMTKEEKFMSVVVYLSKVVEHLKGVDNGQDIYSSRSRRILEDVEKQGVLFSATEGNPSSQSRPERENKGE